MRRRAIWSLQLALIVTASVAWAGPAWSQAGQAAVAFGPRTTDVTSVDSIIGALYGSISGPAGQKRDWDRFRALFAPDARLIVARGRRDSTGAVLPAVLTVDSYIAGAGELERGFFEREIAQVTESFGAIAHRFSTYESRARADDPQPFARGINSIQLLNDGRRWWIVSVFWDSERPNNRIPPRYLPPGAK